MLKRLEKILANFTKHSWPINVSLPMDIVLEIVSEIVFEILVHAIPALWKSSRFFRIAVGIIALIGVLVVARVMHFP
jgi:hypothetical protein